MGEGNENLVYPSPWDFKSSFTCRKILRHGTLRLYFPLERKVCCGLLSPLKIHRLGRVRACNLWVQWHTNHYTTKATEYGYNSYISKTKIMSSWSWNVAFSFLRVSCMSHVSLVIVPRVIVIIFVSIGLYINSEGLWWWCTVKITNF
jgi:hypothetical protein